MKKYFYSFLLVGLLPFIFSAKAMAGLPCTLSAQDYASLAQTKQPLTKETIEQLTEAEKKQLCAVRTFLKLVQSSKDKAAWPIASRSTMFL